MGWGHAFAQLPETGDKPAQAAQETDFFQKGRREAGLVSGVLFSPFVATLNRPSVDYVVNELQLGYMLSDLNEAGWLRGNLELLGQVFGDRIFEGHGTYISGITAWLRYNFVHPKCRLVPFAQAGLGLTATDVDHQLLGETFNFNLHLGVGLRYFVSPNISLSVEYSTSPTPTCPIRISASMPTDPSSACRFSSNPRNPKTAAPCFRNRPHIPSSLSAKH